MLKPISYLLKPFILLILILFVCNKKSIAQNKSNQQQENVKTFNIPPGAVFESDLNTNIDYSYKLKEIPKKTDATSFAVTYFLNLRIKEQELEYMKTALPDSYNYYTEAINYYNNLSNRVKVTFTNEELWYIYIFDQSLKNKLQNIK